MIYRPISVAALLALCLGALPVAAHDPGLAACAKIASVLDRIDCYDTLASAQRNAAAPPPNPAAAPAPPVAVQPAPAPTVAAAPVAVPTPAPAPAPAQLPVTADAPDDGFGFEQQRMKETPDEIRSRYDGSFAGWNGKTVFKLENGQVWRQAEKGRMTHRAERPMLRIRKGLFGSFRLSVEGVSKSVRVERIK